MHLQQQRHTDELKIMHNFFIIQANHSQKLQIVAKLPFIKLLRSLTSLTLHPVQMAKLYYSCPTVKFYPSYTVDHYLTLQVAYPALLYFKCCPSYITLFYMLPILHYPLLYVAYPVLPYFIRCLPCITLF